AAASSRAACSATSEKSTPVTRQPRCASHTALRPAPQATSSARPGGRVSVSAIRNALGVTAAFARSPAQRRFQRSRDGSAAVAMVPNIPRVAWPDEARQAARPPARLPDVIGPRGHDVAVLWSRPSRDAYAARAASRGETYRFTDAWGRPRTWLKGEHAYLAPAGASVLLARCNLKHDLVEEADLAEERLGTVRVLLVP